MLSKDISSHIKEQTQFLLKKAASKPAEKIMEKANKVADAFAKLNGRYKDVHDAVSHSLPLSQDDVCEIKDIISQYMALFRELHPGKCIPKHHFLESHVPEWISNWNVGLALHGEQGGEKIHAVFNSLQTSKRLNVRNPLENLVSVMKEHHIRTSPVVVARQPRI